jgi:hypothetical protein
MAKKLENPLAEITKYIQQLTDEIADKRARWIAEVDGWNHTLLEEHDLSTDHPLRQHLSNLRVLLDRLESLARGASVGKS